MLKALGTVIVWVLVVMGLGSFAWMVGDFLRGTTSAEPAYAGVAWAALTVGTLFLAVAAIKLRQSLD